MQSQSFSDFQARADAVSRALGQGAAPRALDGENLLAYRKRLLSQFAHLSSNWRHADLTGVTDAGVLTIAENQVYADAAKEAAAPSILLRPGELREVTTLDDSGRPIRRFYGDPAACWDAFKAPGRRLIRVGQK